MRPWPAGPLKSLARALLSSSHRSRVSASPFPAALLRSSPAAASSPPCRTQGHSRRVCWYLASHALPPCGCTMQYPLGWPTGAVGTTQQGMSRPAVPAAASSHDRQSKCARSAGQLLTSRKPAAAHDRPPWAPSAPSPPPFPRHPARIAGGGCRRARPLLGTSPCSLLFGLPPPLVPHLPNHLSAACVTIFEP